MKQRIINVLASSIGNGMIKNLVSARGTGAEKYLFEIWKSFLSIKYPNSTLIDARNVDKKDLKRLCLKYKTMKKHCFVLVNHIWSYHDFDSIINICSDDSNIDLFSVSYSKYPLLFPEKSTLIRGRIFTIYFPSTLYEDYIVTYPNKTVIDYLIHNDLDLDVINRNIGTFSPIEKTCFDVILNHYLEPLTYRYLAKEVSERLKINFSPYHAQIMFLKFLRLNLFYLIDRFDIKRNVIVGGKIVFPIDTRFYRDSIFKSEDLSKYMTAAMIAKLFYDNWEVKKCIYISQRHGKTFNGNTDGGFLVRKNNQTFLVFVSDNITQEVLDKARLTPSMLPKIILTMDSMGNIQRDNDGIIYYSYEYFLREGITLYE